MYMNSMPQPDIQLAAYRQTRLFCFLCLRHKFAVQAAPLGQGTTTMQLRSEVLTIVLLWIKVFGNVKPCWVVVTSPVILDCLTLKINALPSSEIPLTIYLSAQHNILTDWTFNKTSTLHKTLALFQSERFKQKSYFPSLFYFPLPNDFNE